MEKEMREHIDSLKKLNTAVKGLRTVIAEYYSSPSPFGGTKDAEYRRTIEMFEDIYKTKGLYYALALLYDSQYENKDLLGMMEILKPGKGKFSDILQKSTIPDNPL
jgi:hypothetical protein